MLGTGSGLCGRRIAVTGSAGFVGRETVAGLLREGARVDGFEDPELVRRGVEVFGAAPVTELLAALEEGRGAPDAVVHLGANSDTTCRDLDLLERVNVGLTRRLVELAVARGVPVVYASSASVYGQSTEFTEDARNERPVNAYAESKLRVDDWHRAQPWFGREPVFGLRLFNVYGPGEESKGRMASMVYRWCREAGAGRPVRVFKGSHGYGDGGHSRDLIYVGDVVRVVLHLLSHAEQTPGGVYNVGTGTATTMLAAAAAVRRHVAPVDLEFIDPPESVLPGYQPFTRADTTRLAAVLPAQVLPSTDIDEGVRLTHERLSRLSAPDHRLAESAVLP